MGCISGFCRIETAKRNSFQMFVNYQMITTAKPGMESGNSTRQYTPRIPAPSMMD
jgi:hypothetical protein